MERGWKNYQEVILSDSKYTREDLKIMQAWPLERKIQVSQTRIIEQYQYYNGMVYVSFSGGKDSTVLLDLVRRAYPDVPAVFCDTGLEFPEIRKFALSHENVVRLESQIYDRHKREYVKFPFNKVIEKYGYPVVSKEQSKFIYEYRTTQSEKLKNRLLNGKKHGMFKISKKWMPLVESDIPVSDKCCKIMKKDPAKRYEKESGRHPYIGTMTDESRLRLNTWIQFGCNAFDKTQPTSQPLSFWTEQDVLQYIKRFNIPYCSIYGDIVENENGKLITTGENRTGCMFCMYGVHLEKYPNKFQRMQITHPKQWDYCMRPIEENGLGLAKVLDFIGVPWKNEDK